VAGAVSPYSSRRPDETGRRVDLHPTSGAARLAALYIEYRPSWSPIVL